MTVKTQFQTLLAYHWHTSRRMLELAAGLDDGEYRQAADYGRGSIHDLLCHILSASRRRRLELETGQHHGPLTENACADLPSLRAGYGDEQAAWVRLLERLSAEEIEAEVELVGRDGQPFHIPRWHILMHVVLHGMQHNSELARLLTASGRSPGNIDFIMYR
jgi:uncharacterized damage-inducible protein DinB